jgi:hypothetical protein
MDVTTAAIIGAAVGSGVTGLFALVTIWLQRAADERRQIRELAVKVAIENFKIYKEASERMGATMLPLDAYLIHAMSVVSALDGSLKTESQIREHLRKAYLASDAAGSVIDERNAKIQEARLKGLV